MRKKLFWVVLLFLTLPFPVIAQGQEWFSPISDYSERNQYKSFGQYFDKSSYIGREDLFPTQFTGFHAAADLEILPGEENKDVPVYAVTDGKISFKGVVGGYGGVILLDMSNDSRTALYGHLKLSSSPLKAGDQVKAGQFLANLGKAFSNETGGERKHLHFGIYNGKSPYFKGYENSEQAIRSKWIDPGAYLKEKGAADISNQPSVKNNNQNTVINNEVVNNNENSSSTSDTGMQVNQDKPAQGEKKSLINNMIEYLKDIFSKIRSAI